METTLSKTFEIKGALCYSCKCEARETETRDQQNRHGSFHAIAWVA